MDLQPCEKLHVDCQHCLCQLSRQSVVYAKKSVYCKSNVPPLFPVHVFFFNPKISAGLGFFKFVKVSEFFDCLLFLKTFACFNGTKIRNIFMLFVKKL
jgi:hypothetical protein